MSISIFRTPPVSPHEAQREEAVLRSGALSIRKDKVLQGIVEEIRASFRARMSAVSLVSQDWQYLIATVGIPTGVYSRRTSFCAHAVASFSPVLYVPDARRDPRFADNPAVEDGLLRFYASAQVQADDLPIGTLCVFDPTPRWEVPGAKLDRLLALARDVSEHLREMKPNPPV